jgi:signal transduction histidine kinase
MNAEIQSLIIIGSVAMLIMAAFLVIFMITYRQKQLRQQMMMKALEENYQRQLLNSSLKGQELERRRMADDLHDDIGTLLSAAKMNISQAIRLPNQNEEARQMINQSHELLEEAIKNVRSLTRELKPSTLDNFGLAAALDELVMKVDSPAVEVSFNFEGKSERFERNTEISIFRIAKELIHNALKHANATHIDASLSKQANRLYLIVRDNGQGFDYDRIKLYDHDGFGLKNIESRLGSLNANIVFDVAKGQGSQIMMEVPL